MKHLKFISLAVIISVIVFAVTLASAWVLLRSSGGNQAPGLPATPSLLSTTDTVSVWMTLLGIMISLASVIMTASGIAIAIFAAFGYQTFKQEVGAKAREAATEAAKTVADASAREAVNGYLRGEEFADTLKTMGSKISWTDGTVDQNLTMPEASKPLRRYPKRAKGG